MTPSKFNVPPYDVESPLSFDVVCIVLHKDIGIPQLEVYNRKGDP